MRRSKDRSRKALAEKALQGAIAEETAELRALLKSRDQRIAQLEGALRGIAQAATGAAGQTAPTPLARPAPPPEPELPQGPAAELAGDDDLGEGRWA